MSKLFVITRDGKRANEFLEENNLTKDDIILVKYASDLKDADGGRYVILPPLPLAYHWSIRIKLIDLNMTNVTKFYNKKLLNF